MTKIIYDPERFRMEIRGHAGAGIAGEDLVCAGISVLTYGLLNAAAERPEYLAHFYINDVEAVIWAQCYPDEEHEAECREMFRTILSAFETMQDTYPDYIDITGGYDG